MTQAEMCEVGFRWTKPTWERTADASWVLIVPAAMLKNAEPARKSDPFGAPSQRMYEIYEFDGNWFDQLHERQPEADHVVERRRHQERQAAREQPGHEHRTLPLARVALEVAVAPAVRTTPVVSVVVARHP